MKKIIIALLIIFISSTAYAALMSESEGGLTFSVTLPTGAVGIKTYHAHIEAGTAINYDGDSINLPDDEESYRGDIESDFDISSDTYYSRSVAKDGELSTKTKALDSDEQWAYSLSIFYLTITPGEDSEIDFEGEFNAEIELESESEEASAFSFAAYSIWIGTISQYNGTWDIFDENYINESILWYQVDGADSYDDDGKDKFKHKNYDLSELGEASEYILLFILDSYSHIDADPPEEAEGFAQRVLFHRNHLPTIEEIKGHSNKGCFISELRRG